MKTATLSLLIIIFFLSCSKEPTLTLKELPHTKLQPSNFEELPQFEEEDFREVLELFKQNCKTNKAFYIYGNLCSEAENVLDVKEFITNNFRPYRIQNDDENNEGLLTGYYEAQIHASYQRSERYKYPIYATPQDLVVVDLSTIYPELKHYRLRGKLQGNRVIPYYTREEAALSDINASVLCYCDSPIDKFFLEVQGSGIAKLDDNSSIYLGYDNQNGHKYRSIGRYLVAHNELSKEEVSLQSIKQWLLKHPDRVDEVLNYNNSMVFFSRREQGATGALGVELKPMRSVAIDKRYISLGSMLYLNADLNNTKINKIVFAQDTGGAIKGPVRADLFVGSGERALEFAGHLKAPLKLWLILPKNERKQSIDE